MKQPNNEAKKKLTIKKMTVSSLSNKTIKHGKDDSVSCLPTTSSWII